VKDREVEEKMEKEKEQQRIEQHQIVRTTPATAHPPTLASALGATVAGSSKKRQMAEVAPSIPFHTSFGKAVLNHILEPKPKPKTEFFLPGRMAFVFDLDEEFPQELPTTLLRSKEDCPKEGDTITGQLDPLILEKMSKVFTFLRQGSKQKKLKKKEKKEKEGTDNQQVKETEKETQSEKQDEKQKEKQKDQTKATVPQKEVPVEEDIDDIFGEDEEYNVPIAPKKQPEKETETKKPQQTYFKKESKEEEEYFKPTTDPKLLLEQAKALAHLQKSSSTEPTPTKTAPSLRESSQEERDRGLPTVFRREGADNRRETDQREKDPSFVSETYSECYPGSYETAIYAYESDEEEDLSKMDLGAKRNKLKRWDFEDEESWNAYNDHREAMPKAAFQFGVKMADGRKTRRTKDKDQKLNTDLQKINQILKKRAEDTAHSKRRPEGANSLIADLELDLEDGEIEPKGAGRRRAHVQVDDDDHDRKRSRRD